VERAIGEKAANKEDATGTCLGVCVILVSAGWRLRQVVACTGNSSCWSATVSKESLVSSSKKIWASGQFKTSLVKL
jgi:dissimilatory sulfite reductase (desulfoviridin) alpha/beta subunit